MRVVEDGFSCGTIAHVETNKSRATYLRAFTTLKVFLIAQSYVNPNDISNSVAVLPVTAIIGAGREWLTRKWIWSWLISWHGCLALYKRNRDVSMSWYRSPQHRLRPVAQRLIELISPTTRSCKICPLRRSVQSYVEISHFFLDEPVSLSAVNNTFPSFRIREKTAARGVQ